MKKMERDARGEGRKVNEVGRQKGNKEEVCMNAGQTHRE